MKIQIQIFRRRHHGHIEPIWYSFDLTTIRVEEGGWTNEVTQKVLPPKKDLAGVRMRLTAGSFRELHWHTADEWAIMLYGNARLTCLNPDGTVFIGDVGKGDLWYFPAGFPHSIQGLEPDGCEFILVFDQGSFSEDNTFLLSDWVRRTPPSVLSKNLGLPATALKNLPTKSLYIFAADLPASLAQDKAAVGGRRVESPYQYTFKMSTMAPTHQIRAAKHAWLTHATSWRRKISLQPWSPLNQAACANCIGILTPLNGNTTLPVRGA
jgi:oxalate decarboxylase